MNYDRETGEITGFYLASRNKNIPENCVEISPDKHLFYVENNGKYKINVTTLEDELIPVIVYEDKLSELELLKIELAETKEVLNYILMNY